MKKILAVLLAVMLCAMAGCGGKEEAEKETKPAEETKEQKEAEETEGESPPPRSP